MGNAIRQLWAFFTTLFTAMENLAGAANNIALVANETSSAYVDEARANRKLQQLSLDKDIAKATTTP
jgi:hypothetical protein